ncbi:MAG: putative spermidine/putrescine transport system permease protein [Thermoleophilaceae bacterium]|nr:putative spermidine/putrescine transport system permease protein [Thermoleophilaceae bacterium]
MSALASRPRRPRRPSHLGLRLLGAVVGLWLVAPTLVVIPMGFTAANTFQFPPSDWTLDRYSSLFSDPAWFDALKTSVIVAVLVTALATVLGTAAAFGLSRSRFRMKPAISAVLLVPMVVPTVVVAIAIYAIFLKWRFVGTLHGFVLAHTLLALPFVFVPVTASLQTFDRRLERAAASLGAPPLRAFLQVTLPSIRSGVLTGALFAFITSFDELVVSLFLGTATVRTLPVQMYGSVTREIDPTVAAASTVTLLLTTTLLLAVLFRPQREAVL